MAWNNSSIVDPLFTLPLVGLVAAAVIFSKRHFAIAAMVWALGYLGFGWLQQERAMAVAEAQAVARGHDPQRLSVKPSFGNIFLFKSIYQDQGFYYVDAVRVAVDEHWCEGSRIEQFDQARSFPDLPSNSQQAKDIARFSWFSHDYLAQDPTGRVIDMRYSMLPDSIDPMWGIVVDAERPNDHVSWWASRELGPGELDRFTDLLLGRGCKQASAIE